MFPTIQWRCRVAISTAVNFPLPQVDIGALGLHQVCPGGHFREKWWVTDENGNILYGGSFMILMLFDSTATCEGNGIFKYYEGCFYVWEQFRPG